MASAKKIFVAVQTANITKIYDKSMKADLIKAMAKAAKTVIDKNNKLTSSKPAGWKKEKDKGFVLNMTLVSLSEAKANKELIIKASVTALVADAKTGKGIKSLLSGNGTLKVSETHKNPKGEALYIAGFAIADLIKKKAFNIILA